MRRLKFIVLALVLSIVTSCAERASSSEGQVPWLLKSVCSDALVVRYSSSCESLLSGLDSTHVLRRLSYGTLSKQAAVLSTSYLGSNVSTISIALPDTIGKTGNDPSAPQDSPAALLQQAQRLRLRAKVFSVDGHRTLIITNSDAALSALERHISEGRSVLDAPSFQSAAAAAAGGDFHIYRCGNSQRYIPRSFLDGVFPRRALTRFADRIADWIVLRADGEVRLINGQGSWGFAQMLQSLPCAQSRLGAALPVDFEFALSVPVEIGSFREAYEKFADASVRLNQYNQTLQALKKSRGKDPLKWEKEIGVKELALIKLSKGGKVVLLRTDKEDFAIRPNPYQGFLPALYGSAFTPSGDDYIASQLGYLIIGSGADVDSYISSAKSSEQPRWTNHDTHLIIDYSGSCLEWSKKEIRIWNSAQ